MIHVLLHALNILITLKKAFGLESQIFKIKPKWSGVATNGMPMWYLSIGNKFVIFLSFHCHKNELTIAVLLFLNEDYLNKLCSCFIKDRVPNGLSTCFALQNSLQIQCTLRMHWFVEKLVYKRQITNPEVDGFPRYYMKDCWVHR